VLLSFIVLQRSEVFFLNHYSTNSEIAHFSIAFSLVVALAAAPRAVEVFVLPSVATLIQAQDEERIARGIARMLRLASLVTIPLTIAALTFGPSIIRLLYGQEYADTGTVFLVLVVQLPLVPLVAGGTALLMAYGTRTRALIASYAVAASINVLMAWALIPHYGAYGAAAANLAGVVTLAALILRSCLRVLGPFSFGWGTIGRMTAASLLGAVAAAPVLIVGEGGIPLLLAGAIGLTSFVAALFVIRPLTREDSEWISRLPTAHSRRVVQPMLTRMSRSGDELDSAPL
jgi:O-antigen/teichoic acid export membrane protein